MTKVAYMMIGLPGSGKSTLIEKEILPKIGGTVVSSDAYIQKIADEQNKTYNEVFEDNISNAIEKMWEQANDLADKEETIIWDQTMVSTDRREEVIEFLKEKGYMIFGICFDITEETMPILIARNKNRPGKDIPESVQWHMFYHYERPTTEEGFNMLTYIDIT